MRRRQFIGLVGCAAVLRPLAAHAQLQAGKLPTIGFLGAATASGWSSWVTTFEKRLRELGWVEGRTIAIEYRWAEGRSDRSAEIAAEFVRLKVDIIVAAGYRGPRASKQATSVIPIVFASAADPVGDGLVASLARPGRQRYRPVKPGDRSCWQATRTVARSCTRSPPLGDLGQCRLSRRRAGNATRFRQQPACSGSRSTVLEIRRSEDIASAFEAIKGRRRCTLRR